jgi:hypothetical protein
VLIHEQVRGRPARTPAPPVLAREIGWKGARGANKEQRRTTAGEHAVERIPIDGIKGSGMPAKAIVVVPSQLASGARDARNPRPGASPPLAGLVDVLLHLHGFTPGYATADDLGVYKIEAQMAAAGKELIGILPQGTANSDFNGAGAGKAFDPDAFIAAVFARLGEEGYAVKPGRVIMSSHSGGDQPLAETVKFKPPEKLAGLFLFDSMIASSFGGAVWNHVETRITAELAHLRQCDPAQRATWIAGNGFRLVVVYRKGGDYQAAAKAIEANLTAKLGTAEPELVALLRGHYAVHEVTDTARIQHMDVLAGDDALRKAIETLPTEEAPSQPRLERSAIEWAAPHVGNHAIARLLARDTAVQAPPETVTTTLRWNTTEPPKAYLKDAFDDHPVDWKADVYVDGKKAGSGDGSLDVELVKGSKHTVRIVPTPAGSDNDFYLPSVTKEFTVADGGTVDVKLQYNRSNRWFTDESWEKAGIDPAKAADMTTATMLGKSIQVNKQVLPTVKKTNDYFASSKLTDAERAEVTASIVSMGGYNRRTTSKGAFSNHSIGCAVDINPLIETGQNDHVLKDDKAQARRMELFQHVVRRDSGWSSFDVWAETDTQKWLEANRLFNFHFPLFLAELLDDVKGGDANTVLAEWAEAFDWIAGTTTLVGRAMVSSVDAAQLGKSAKAAKKAGKTETAKWLERLVADWPQVRAWIDGVVVFRDGTYANVADYEAKVGAGKEKRTPVGRLQGMIPLHPKLVETMEAGGWTWLVDQTEAKDFMHFEDRAAFTALKR